MARRLYARQPTQRPGTPGPSFLSDCFENQCSYRTGLAEGARLGSPTPILAPPVPPAWRRQAPRMILAASMARPWAILARRAQLLRRSNSQPHFLRNVLPIAL